MSDRIPRKFARELIANALPKVLLRLAARLYGQQTTEEQACAETLERNGVGFNKSDAFPITHLLSRFQRGLDSDAVDSQPAIAALRARLMKYASQIVKLLDAKSPRADPEQPLDLERAIHLPYFYLLTHHIRCTYKHKLPNGTVVRREARFPRKYCDYVRHDDDSVTIYAPLWWLRRSRLVDADDKLLITDQALYKAPPAQKPPGMSAAKRKDIQMRLKMGGTLA